MEFNTEARRLAMCCHLLSLTCYLTGIGLLLAPLILWLTKRNSSPHVDDQGRESVNFQITMILVGAIGVLLAGLGVGLVVLLVLPIFHFVFTLIAAIRANDGIAYRYPLCLRFLK